VDHLLGSRQDWTRSTPQSYEGTRLCLVGSPTPVSAALCRPRESEERRIHERQGFHDLEALLHVLFEEGAYSRALEALDTLDADYSDQAVILQLLRARILGGLGRPDEALEALQAGLNQGLWWSRDTLLSARELAPLQMHPSFLRVVRQCDARHHEAASGRDRELVMYVPDSGSSAPMTLIALNGRGRGSRYFASHWTSVVDRGIGLAVPQSGRSFAHGLYEWVSADHAQRELDALCASLRDTEWFDSSSFIAAGYSDAALLASIAALKGTVRAFIAVAPTLRFAAALHQTIASPGYKIPATHTCGAIIVGRTSGTYRSAEALHAILRSLGVASRLLTDERMSDSFPPNFDSLLKQAIEFCSSRINELAGRS